MTMNAFSEKMDEVITERRHRVHSVVVTHSFTVDSQQPDNE